MPPGSGGSAALVDEPAKDVESLGSALPASPTPLGCAVIPARCTRRRSTSTKNNTYSRVKPIVSTVKKSVASAPAACERRKSTQLRPPRRGAGPTPYRRKIARTDEADTATPSLRASPRSAGEREEFIDGLCALGEVADVQRGIERYWAAGATNPVVTGILGTDYAATLRAAAADPAGSTDG
jgi:hypothetical protein